MILKDTEKKGPFLSTKISFSSFEEKEISFFSFEDLFGGLQGEEGDLLHALEGHGEEDLPLVHKRGGEENLLGGGGDEISFFFSFSFASSKDLEEEISFSSIIFEFWRAS